MSTTAVRRRGPADRLHRVSLATRDPEQAHAHIRSTYADHSVQLSGSLDRFRFRHDLADAGTFSVAHYQHSMTCTVRSDPLGFLLVGQVLGGHLRVATAHREVRAVPGDVVLFEPGEPMTVEWSDFRAGLVRLAPGVVDRVAAEVFGDVGAGGVRFTLGPAVSAARARHWHGLVRYLQRDLLADDAVADSPLIRAQAVRLLAATALDTFPHTALAAGQRGPGAADPSAVRRALAFIDEHAGDPIGVGDIADAARLGPRALQAAFRRHLDTTPSARLREVRLEGVHRDLQAADPTAGATVARIARRWGFAHLGRFAGLYRERFGCLPSRTLEG
jgi:AraC-like DNA-binding protein